MSDRTTSGDMGNISHLRSAQLSDIILPSPPNPIAGITRMGRGRDDAQSCSTVLKAILVHHATMQLLLSGTKFFNSIQPSEITIEQK
jgi:hypothetical protein